MVNNKNNDLFQHSHCIQTCEIFPQPRRIRLWWMCLGWFFFFVATRHSHNRTFSHRLRWWASTARGPPSWAERDWPCCLASRDYMTHSSRESTLGVYFCDIKPIVFFQMVFSSLHLHYTIIMLKTYLIKMSLKAN